MAMAHIDDDLIETLLRSSEGTTLDFKSQQYSLDSDEKKSELIKDILAMANAWKTSDAYIVIGVVDGTGARAEVIGGVQHFDDANLQQLVNSKTNRPVVFEYIPREFEGKAIAILRIAKDQARPLIPKSAFGRLARGTVYLRQGSSTRVADAIEIEKMVELRTVDEPPSLQLLLRSRPDEAGARVVSVRSVTLQHRGPVMDDPVRTSISPFEPRREAVAAYVFGQARMKPVYIEVRNVGKTVARDVEVQLTAPTVSGAEVRSEPPERPSAFYVMAPAFGKDVFAKVAGSNIEVTAHLGKIQPGRSKVSDPIWVGAYDTCRLEFTATLSSDETRELLETQVSVQVLASQEPEGSLEEAIEEFYR